MVKFEQKMKRLHNCTQLTLCALCSVVKSSGFKLVAYRHNECLGLEPFMVTPARGRKACAKFSPSAILPNPGIPPEFQSAYLSTMFSLHG